MRTHSDNTVGTTYSTNEGRSWKRVESAEVASPNSGLCAITLQDGRVLMVHNDATKGRAALLISISNDNGQTYNKVATLEDEGKRFKRPGECFDPDDPKAEDSPEYSYPTVIQSPSRGLVHITYTFSYFGSGGRCTGRETVKHVVIDPCHLGDVRHAPLPCILPGSNNM